MALSMFKPCLLLIFAIALSDAWLNFKGPDCDEMDDCDSCTKTKSWSGKSCRWCPTDKQCHAHGAVFTNPCSKTQNIDSPSGCASIVNLNYDRSLAYKMVYLCALAYADSVSKYIPKATQVGCERTTTQMILLCHLSSILIQISHFFTKQRVLTKPTFKWCNLTILYETVACQIHLFLHAKFETDFFI